MNRNFLLRIIIALILIAALMCSGCSAKNTKNANNGKIPEIPEKLSENEDGIPVLRVFNTATDEVEKTDIESYIMGVVAGEMKNTWPLEALKAQAILARTFTMKFVSSKESGYEGADISTDVKEAQAYDANAINDRVREAVNETRGLVMIADGDFPYAWFHAHSGGTTELPSKALEYKNDPSYLKITDSPEAEDAPEDVKSWTSDFSKEEIVAACAASGLKIDGIDSFEIGARGGSGRAVTFVINGKEVSAPSFRLNIGANKLKSTMIDSIELLENSVRFRGKGFGHGVGMSQWGAYQMAEDGKRAEDIVHHYFTGVDIVELW